jgi:membrane protease YdiL (CAAX protease family)
MNDPLADHAHDESPEAALPAETPPPVRHHQTQFWALLAALAVVYALTWWFGAWATRQGNNLDPRLVRAGELALRLAAAGLVVVPLVPLVALAQLGRSSDAARILTLGYWSLLAAGGLLIMIALVIGALAGPEFLAKAEAGQGDPAEALRNAMPPESWKIVGWSVIWGLVTGLIGFIAFLPAGRRLAARLFPIDPTLFTDVTAVATVVPLTIGCLLPLVLLGDAPVLMLLKHQGANKLADGLDDQSLFDLYAQLIWAIPIAIIAAGYPLYRDMPAALRRLGLVVPTGRQVIAAVAIAVLLVPAMLGLDAGMTWLWQRMNWPATDATTFEKMMEFALTGAGAVAIGITAGISEELAFRGLLQPRLGLLLSNLFFTAMHAFQYHWDALIAVFLIGLVCGLVRRSMNTTAAILVHGLYDTLLVTLAVVQRQAAG